MKKIPGLVLFLVLIYGWNPDLMARQYQADSLSVKTGIPNAYRGDIAVAIPNAYHHSTPSDMSVEIPNAYKIEKRLIVPGQLRRKSDSTISLPPLPADRIRPLQPVVPGQLRGKSDSTIFLPPLPSGRIRPQGP